MRLVDYADAVRSRPLVGYAVAILLTLAALALRFAIGDVLVGFPFLTFVPAFVVAAFVGGLGPGLLAAALGGLLADYYLIEPIGSFALAWPAGWIAMGFYVLLASLVIGPMEGMFRIRAQLRELNEVLEQRVAERTAALETEMREREEVEAQLRQVQKMETVGRLTGGIAHDFNNMMAIVIGSLDLARRRLTGDENPRVAAGIDNALEGAQRAAGLTARLLAFSRRLALEPQPVDANKLVGGMSEMLRRTLGEIIRVETVLAGGLWRCFADPAQLESAIVNLAVNARDAMPTGGRLTVETANTDLDDRYARAHSEVTAGQYVMVSVTDEGIGMSPEVAERAFEPFYTTKGVGHGTGLGLSQVYGFVKQSGGHVKIYSEVARGSTVKIYLPRHHGETAQSKPTGATPLSDLAPPVGATVLVVEDEEQVRHMSVDALRALGYAVVQANGGNQALEQLSLQPKIDLLFTDIVMPDMTGRELADKALVMRPDLRVLFTTGYTRNAVVHNGVLDQGVAFLPKPFTVEQLALKVGDVLAGRGANR
ncbi:ATP-binding protein [Hansschlegelia zhihuaiae]|uniref:histidine kinase n=1 Tax=Hansschlegelia zhihuaiae TaxID=405005 RepID=A0A4Q0MJ74_9HYPH|nr:ATP-binding protein [Hansschlegelia zhihuaiae]RXF73751.1 response regulator [Hansschlegelia zhihuaiae]